jgi:hypothetical protein
VSVSVTVIVAGNVNMTGTVAETISEPPKIARTSREKAPLEASKKKDAGPRTNSRSTDMRVLI